VVKLGTRLPTIPCRAVLRFLRDLQRCGDLDSCHDREAGKNPTQRTRTSRPGPRPPGESGSAGQKRSWTPQELLICAHRATHGAKSRRKLESAEQLHSGPFLACPKVYDLYAVCVAGLNRLIPRHLSESRVVYGQARACLCCSIAEQVYSRMTLRRRHDARIHGRNGIIMPSMKTAIQGSRPNAYLSPSIWEKMR
jgi:hypothetical protein